MSGMFLNSNKPLHTCTAENCNGCEVAEKLVCHFNIRQLLIFLLIAIPVFLLAGYVIYQFDLFLLIPWLLFIISYFGFIEIRVMCSHCPHYAEPEIKSLKCWANYGSRKFWKYRPGPMSLYEIVIFYAGFIIILGTPIVFAILQNMYVLLGMYIVLIATWKWILKKLYCNHCINFACPFNNIDSEMTGEFFNKNPTVKEAWEK